MKKLIVNADGFGFTAGCNRGIFETIENGIVTSVSVNMNFPAAEDTPRLQKEYPQISIGIHLNPVVGPPVTQLTKIKTLINPETNEFWGGVEFTQRLTKKRINLRELALELSNQLQKAIDLGIQISHIDSHQNRHLHPFYFKVFLALGEKFDIKKMRTHDYYLFSSNGSSEVFKHYLHNPWRFVVHNVHRLNMAKAKKRGFNMADRNLIFYLLEKGAKYIKDNWVFVLRNLPEGVSEVYIHPAYPDETLAKYATYSNERDAERRLLQDPVLKKIIAEEKIELISFAGLP